jgi:hypothetical protein
VDLTQKVLARWVASKEVPVKNKDTGRTVYVLPETLSKDPGRFEKVRPETVGDPRWRGKAKPPKRPKKPERPEIPRDTPPAPVKPPVLPKRVKPPKPVKPVPLLKGPKVPEPSPFRRWKKVKRFLSAEDVVARYLSDDHLGSPGRG